MRTSQNVTSWLYTGSRVFRNSWRARQNIPPVSSGDIHLPFKQDKTANATDGDGASLRNAIAQKELCETMAALQKAITIDGEIFRVPYLFIVKIFISTLYSVIQVKQIANKMISKLYTWSRLIYPTKRYSTVR